MRRINVLLRIMIALLLTIGGMSFSQQVVPWDKADQYYDQDVTVEGTIVSTTLAKKATAYFLNFNSDWHQGLTAIIFSGDFSKFPPKPQRIL